MLRSLIPIPLFITWFLALDIGGASRLTLTHHESSLSSDSLSQLLTTILDSELRGCDVVLAYDDSGVYESQMTNLFTHGNVMRVAQVKSQVDIQMVMGTKAECSTYMFLLADHAHLFSLSQSEDEYWDYKGRFIIVGSTTKKLEILANSVKGRKTKHILGIIKTSTEGEWALYTNQPYDNKGIARINSFRVNKFTSPNALFPEKFTDLGGITLKVVTFRWEPNVFYGDGDAGPEIYGVDIDVVNTVGEVLNFTAEFIEPPKGELWGDKMPNGSWSGMMGLLNTGQADMGAASIYVSITRAEAVDFTAPYDSRLSCFMARTEPPLPRWQALAFPFQLWTWLALLLALALIGAFLYIIVVGNSSDTPEVPELTTLSSCLYYTFGLHFKIPQSQVPRRSSAQVMVGVLWFYVTILTAAYSTNLTAFLIVSRPPTSIETVKQLREKGLDVAALGEFYRNALASATDANLQALTNTYKSHKSVETIFPKVMDGTSVFLQNSAFIEYVTASRFTKKGLAATRMMRECFAPYSIALAVQKHSPLKDKVDLVIGRLRDSGLIRQYFLKSLRKATAAQEEENGDDLTKENGVIPLRMDHLQGIFMVACLGLSISLFVFFVEFLSEWKRNGGN